MGADSGTWPRVARESWLGAPGDHQDKVHVTIIYNGICYGFAVLGKGITIFRHFPDNTLINMDYLRYIQKRVMDINDSDALNNKCVQSMLHCVATVWQNLGIDRAVQVLFIFV